MDEQITYFVSAKQYLSIKWYENQQSTLSKMKTIYTSS